MTNSDTKGPQMLQPPPSHVGRIMIVDDELTLAELMAEMAQELGYESESFSDPSQALAAFTSSSGSYDIVICDQTMPSMSGLELIEQMKRIKPTLGAILCSGFTRRATEQSAAIDPAVRFLNKPYTFEMLQRTLEELTAELKAQRGS